MGVNIYNGNPIGHVSRTLYDRMYCDASTLDRKT
jgi:hypothetical protein